MLGTPDPVARDAAAALLGEARATEATAALTARLARGGEADDHVREGVVRALRAIGDPLAVPALVDAADREVEPDIAVEMSIAAFEIAGTGQDTHLRRAADALARVLADADAPRAARRDAVEALRTHVAIDASVTDDTLAAWWRSHRDAMQWRPAEHKLAPAG